MLTPYGKFIKKVRIDRDENTIPFANRVGVSRQYINSIEHGKSPLPLKWVKDIIDHYRLSKSEQKEFLSLVICSRKYKTRTTEFGKYLMKLRIDRNQLSKDMAKMLQISPSTLSNVERGRAQIPLNWIPVIINKMKLNQEEQDNLKDIVFNTELKRYSKRLKQKIKNGAKV